MSEEIDKFIVAVSGGVDSVVLVDALASGRLSELINGQDIDSRLRGNDGGVELVVAHYDHGIREDSAQDAKFVESLAKKYGLQFEISHGKLGADVSEAEAREMRYNFLRQSCKKHKALEIITAHHQDDLIETAVINLLRGTGWRGLAPMVQTSDDKSQIANNCQMPNAKCQILRPLLGITKKELIDYAKKHNLKWREDSSNDDQDFLRNYVRLTLLPAALKTDPAFNKNMLSLIESTKSLRVQINCEISDLISSFQLPTSNFQIPRYYLIMWPDSVAREVIYSILVLLNPSWHPQRIQIDRVLHFVKTAKAGKQLQVSGSLLIEVDQDLTSFQFIP